MILAVAGGIIAINVYLDIYGVFRDPRGRHLRVDNDERLTKYLLNGRYVPANFNTLMIGSSVSENWRLDKIGQLHTFNDSVNGGNIVEEKSMVDAALSRPGIQVALLIVHPFFTHSHNFETVPLTPRLRTEALGSLSLWDAYKNKARIQLHLDQHIFDEYGSEDFATARAELPLQLKRLMEMSGDFEVDPIAFRAYREVVFELHAHGVQIVFIVPPPEQRLFVPKRAAFQKYFNTIRTVMDPTDKVIDFTTDEFADFRADPANFQDGVHLLPAGAARLVSVINARVQDWIARGELRPPT
ncbi:MAG TPA: hypothetical protein VNV82_04015 [Bryobacteraceae bacterium]|nr:hypothetical protein [Bryobacteraceae bacterium]